MGRKGRGKPMSAETKAMLAARRGGGGGGTRIVRVGVKPAHHKKPGLIAQGKHAIQSGAFAMPTLVGGILALTPAFFFANDLHSSGFNTAFLNRQQAWKNDLFGIAVGVGTIVIGQRVISAIRGR